MASITLSQDEIEDITGLIQFKAQVRALNNMGIPCKPRGDGSPCVLRSAVEAAMGVPESSRQKKETVTIDFAAL